MTNKEKLKNAIEQDFDSKKYYDEIIQRIKKGDKMKKHNYIWKLTLVPICLVLIIGGILYANSKSKSITLDNYVDKENNIKLNINNLEKMGAMKLDADVKEIPTDGDGYWLGVTKDDDITIPKDLNKINGYNIYTRKDKTSEYNILNCHVYNYFNDNNDRNIQIAYSDTNKPIRDYYFSNEGSKVTIINDVELTIFKYNTIYFTEFNYKDYNFDIETDNINEQELSDLLVSIIK